MDLIVLALLGMLGIFGAVFSKLLADEFKAWAPSLVAKIIAVAVRKLPAAKRERFSEEWESHAREVPGDLGKIAAACGCLTAAWEIAEGPLGARKRSLDLAVATCALLLLTPLLISGLLLVVGSSPGPIVVRQTRVGRDGKFFQALKFRTMYIDAADRLTVFLASNPEAEREWKATERLQFDPRVTPLGSFMRKTSLDELPQLFNVLAGDMSLVGPRPLTEDDLGKQIPSDETYTTCKPGITGLWIFGRNLKNVASYTRNWSLMLDVKIILATIPALLRRNEEVEYSRDFDADWRIGLLVILVPLALLGAPVLPRLLGLF
jgi:exopolysaccharide production protein ExoY